MSFCLRMSQRLGYGLRGESGFPAGAEVIMADSVIRIPALSVELSLIEIYRGFVADEAKN